MSLHISNKRRTAMGRYARTTSMLAALAFLAACKGGTGTGTFGFNYGSPYAPPAPENGSVLAGYPVQFGPGQVATLQGQAQTLLATAKYAIQLTNLVVRLNSGGQVVVRTNPLNSSGVAFAHAAGITGAGQTVVVVDTHINQNHEVFTNKISGSVTLATTNTPLTTDTGENDHGTMVASIVGGNSPTMTGVAPGANIIYGNWTNDLTTYDATVAAINSGAVAMNNSWGYDGYAVGTSAYQTLFSSTSGANYLSALRTYAQQGVVVFAVSNDDAKTHATIMDALPYVDPTLEAGWIAVGNAVPTMNSAGNVASVTMLSNGCWEAARWCILGNGSWNHMATTHAPGSTATSNTSYDYGTGSSFAAPQVSGALALLAEAFPTLTPHQLRVRLLAAADNKFFAPDATVELATGFNKGYSYRYGMGFLDVEAALLPIGPSQMSLANGTSVVTDQPVIMSGSAMGDALTKSLASIDVAVTDILDAPFLQRADSLAATVTPAPLARNLLAKSFGTNLTAAREMAVGGLNDPFASFQGATWQTQTPDAGATASVLMMGGEGFGLGLRRAVTDGPTRVEVGFKVGRDNGDVMGFGAAGDTGTNMVSLELGLTQDLGNGGFFSLAGEVGIADLGNPAMLSSVSTAQFDSVNLQIGTNNAFNDGDRISFGVGLPVAVSNAHAEAILPVASAKGVAFTPIDIDLSPSDRQTDISLTYQTPIAENTELLAKIVHAENYGNRAGETDTGAVLAISFSF